MAFNAAVQALDELDSRWRPLRLEPDAAPAAWLVASERHALQGLTKCLGAARASRGAMGSNIAVELIEYG